MALASQRHSMTPMSKREKATPVTPIAAEKRRRTLLKGESNERWERILGKIKEWLRCNP
jgi:hypothetical protein